MMLRPNQSGGHAHINLHLARLPRKVLGWCRLRVTGVVASRGMLFVAQMMSQFAVEGALKQGLGGVVAAGRPGEQVVGFCVVFQQFIGAVSVMA